MKLRIRLAKNLAAILVVLGVVAGIIALVFAIGALTALPVWALWNWIAAGVFHLPTMTFWQTYGLMLLVNIIVSLFTRSGK